MQVRAAIEQKREQLMLDYKMQLLYQIYHMNIDKVQADGGWDYIFSIIPEISGLPYEEQESLKQQTTSIWPQYSQ